MAISYVFLLVLSSLICMCFTTVNYNFVLIITDDQDLLLNGMIPMKKTIKNVANRGKTFVNAFVNSPICCPNRGAILTGKYPHNHGIRNNSLSGNCSSKEWQNTEEPFSIASVLKNKKNYTTFYAGKYLNQYGSPLVGGTKHVPKGYDWWIGLKGNSKYYNYTLSLNGTGVFFGEQYLTDVLAIYSLDFLNQRAIIESPFFMILAPPAPHSPFTPAKRHMKKFNKIKALRTPSFNFSSVDKHWLVQMPPKNLPENITILDRIQRNRLRALLSVDEMVEKIVIKLKQLDVWNKTYLIFTSDNGFHIGQFTQPWDKRQPYQTDVRVPLIFSGPKIPRKSCEFYPVSSVDLAPTIFDMAGVNVSSNLDGKSFKQQLLSKKYGSGFKEIVFVEYFGEGNSKTTDQSCPWKYDEHLSECTQDQWCKCQDSLNNTYSCVIEFSLNDEFKFCHFKDKENFMEAYNLTVDYYELKNIHHEMDQNIVKRFKQILQRFESCSGRNCHNIV